jgi:hypothetical protein
LQLGRVAGLDGFIEVEQGNRVSVSVSLVVGAERLRRQLLACFWDFDPSAPAKQSLTLAEKRTPRLVNVLFPSNLSNGTFPQEVR